MNNNSKAVIITGASHRIGLTLARHCIKLGYKVILHYRTFHSELENSLSTDSTLKNNIFQVEQELTNKPETLIETALSFPVTICGLINNASVFSEGNMSDCNHLETALQINAMIPARLTTALYHSINTGWVINITDSLCTHSNIRFQNYRISKQMLELITRQQALLFAPNLRVNGIAPGAMLPSADETTYFDLLTSKIPLKRTGDTDSLNRALTFLIESTYITGEIIKVDGGWNLL